MSKQLSVGHNLIKNKELTRSEARKLSPGQLFNFVQSPSSMCPPTNETGGHNFGTDTSLLGLNTGESVHCSTGNLVATVRPQVSWAGVLGVDPAWHLPGLWSSQSPSVAADNEFQVGSRTCKSANLELIGSKVKNVLCCSEIKEQGRTTATNKITSTYPRLE